MKLKKLSLFIIIFFTGLYAFSQNNRLVDAETAKQAGLNFIHNISKTSKSITDLELMYKFTPNFNNKLGLKLLDTTVYMYVFKTLPNNGFVIVSADKRVFPIIGYSDENSFSVDQMPSNLTYWFNNYISEIKTAVLDTSSKSINIDLWDNLLIGYLDSLNELDRRSSNSIGKKSNSVNLISTRATTTLPDFVLPLIKTKWNQSPDAANGGNKNTYNIN